MSEKLTRELIESHLLDFIKIDSEKQKDGVKRWSWMLSQMACEGYDPKPEDRMCTHEFKSFETARKFALGWIRRNRPALEKAAVQEAKEGIKYRASRVN